ncbi:MAG TPA: DUF2971 domain-containing protein [Longimicrobiaceae bacterium]|nr:DUF2971 domain-containing protein [Longimicrobiaceae bacterium]
MPIPKRLYKFQPFTTQSIANLKNRQLWFSKPSRFNDPFDCRLRMDDHELSEADLRQLFAHYRARVPDPSALDAKYLCDGRLSDQFREEVRRGSAKAFQERVAVNLNQRGVCCFSETVDNLLMWSHYTGGHHGFCLEFDTSYEPFHQAKKVEYSDAVPAINVAQALLSPKHGHLLSMITTKSNCWAYEREWRILHLEPDIAYTYPWQCLTGVYFGASMDHTSKEIISMILHNSPTKLYEVAAGDRSFSLSISEAEYTPFDYKA